MRLILLLLALCGCTEVYKVADGPSVSYELKGFTGPQRRHIETGAMLWRTACFDVLTLEQSTADNGWPFKGDIHITVEEVDEIRWEGGKEIIGRAQRWRNHIEIVGHANGNQLIAIAAHEFGHILLDVSKHLQDGEAIMRPSVNGQLIELTATDLAYSCGATQLCGICE